MSAATDICICGHERRDHIRCDGACRPGFTCAAGCKHFRERERENQRRTNEEPVYQIWDYAPLDLISDAALRAFLSEAITATVVERAALPRERTYDRGCLDGQFQALQRVARFFGRAESERAALYEPDPDESVIEWMEGPSFLERWRAARFAKRRVRERLSGWNARTGVYEKGGLQPANAPAPPRGQHAVPNPPRGSGRK